MRVIFYYMNDDLPLYALLACAKTAKTDMTPDEKAKVRSFVEALKASVRRPQ